MIMSSIPLHQLQGSKMTGTSPQDHQARMEFQLWLWLGWLPAPDSTEMRAPGFSQEHPGKSPGSQEKSSGTNRGQEFDFFI